MPGSRKFWRRELIDLGLDELPWTKSALQFGATAWPFCGDPKARNGRTCRATVLARSAADWLEPLLADKTARGQIGADELSDAVMTLLPWNLRRRLDAEAPTHFTAPTGSAVPIDYEAEQGPTVSIRVQELFGLATHPSIAGGRVPLVIELLVAGAPAGAGDARSARLLARQLRAGQIRDARPLPAPPLAGRPADRAGDAAGQAPRRIVSS